MKLTTKSQNSLALCHAIEACGASTELTNAVIIASNNVLDFADLRDANVRRCKEVFHPLNDWSPTDWATAMAGECGEACNEVKKLRRLDGADHEQDTEAKRAELREKIGTELADVVIYADLLAARLGINLGQFVIGKFNEVSERRESTVRL